MTLYLSKLKEKVFFFFKLDTNYTLTNLTMKVCV